MFFLKPIDERILKLSMRDTARYSIISLPIISVFEIFMILRWIIVGKSISDPGAAAYLIGYTVLLLTSIAALFSILQFRKDIEGNYRKINIVQTVYAIIILAWSLEITFVGSYFFHYFDYLVYVTIIILVPVFCFLPQILWVLLEILASVLIYYLASFEKGFSAFLINFSVFTIISILASWVLYQVRVSGYQRQLELAEERDQSLFHANHDSLTGLPNRACYVEEFDQLSSSDHQDTLVLAVFDIDDLKKVNDSQGHHAGDELIKGASNCLVQAFSDLGTVYRVGGDEYIGIFHCSSDELTKAIQNYRSIEKTWKGSMVKDLWVSIGTAAAADYPHATFNELQTIADDAMYAEKKLHKDSPKS